MKEAHRGEKCDFGKATLFLEVRKSQRSNSLKEEPRVERSAVLEVRRRNCSVGSPASEVRCWKTDIGEESTLSKKRKIFNRLSIVRTWYRSSHENGGNVFQEGLEILILQRFHRRNQVLPPCIYISRSFSDPNRHYLRCRHHGRIRRHGPSILFISSFVCLNVRKISKTVIYLIL